MKNIQLIDAAQNCTYSIFGISEDDFRKIFHEEGQDVEFMKDFIIRVGDAEADEICRRLWSSPIEKPDVVGIHGTLFLDLDNKKGFYPTKKESEIIAFPEGD